ncbi:MAG: hypothetical protein A2033_13375 [Bacteroidetes bacterium GWA2_31_9]|nr:MAG: hypothetical protein A2033_13375 [Bacteroidetes bacterium GWA2_31_9]
MLYNISYKKTDFDLSTKSVRIYGLNKKRLNEFIIKYERGIDNFFYCGKSYYIGSILEIKVYDTSYKDGITKEGIDDYIIKNTKIFAVSLSEFGIDVTDEFIKGPFGFKKETNELLTITNKTLSYIDLTRVEELKNITNPNFDLKKLIRLCEELNIAYQNTCYYSVGALVRAIIDHLPPVFQFKNFDEVANNYKSEGNSRSFTNSMKHLNSPMRFISDASIHSQIRKSEILPNETQIDCKKELDVLLGEVIRVLKL